MTSSVFCWKLVAALYNNEHHHWGLGLMTPATIHTGRATEALAARQVTLSRSVNRDARTLRPSRTTSAATTCGRLDQPTSRHPKPGKTTTHATLNSTRQCLKVVDTFRNTHEYDSITNPFDDKKKVFEAYAQNQTPGAYRVFWCYGPEDQEITIIRAAGLDAVSADRK